MNVTKNPRIKYKAGLDDFCRLAELNASHLSRLLYTLHKREPRDFYPEKCKRFVNVYKDSVDYIDGDNDAEIRAHKLRQLVSGAPYIDSELVDNILLCFEISARKEDKRLYGVKAYRTMLKDNILLELLTLHYDFGYGGRRIREVASAWTKSDPEEAQRFMDKLGCLADDTQEANERAALEIIEYRKYNRKPPKTAISEQKAAKRQLESYRAYTEGRTE